ncbi:hypothetical protein GCM10009603_27660 [Nocardiopsis exhalans]
MFASEAARREVVSCFVATLVPENQTLIDARDPGRSGRSGRRFVLPVTATWHRALSSRNEPPPRTAARGPDCVGLGPG